MVVNGAALLAVVAFCAGPIDAFAPVLTTKTSAFRATKIVSLKATAQEDEIAALKAAAAKAREEASRLSAVSPYCCG